VFLHGGGCFPLPVCAYLTTAGADNKGAGRGCHNSSFFEGGLSLSAMGVPFWIAEMAVFCTVMQSQGFSHDYFQFSSQALLTSPGNQAPEIPVQALSGGHQPLACRHVDAVCSPTVCRGE
jgi:hypothetical protein